jgi:hypothetical protein
MQVHISKMTGKLDGFKAISTNTVTNSFCIKMNATGDTICRQCYSHGMLKSYRKNMQGALQRNSDLLSSRILDQSELPTILDAFFRINAHGELINAEHNPHCNVAVWTKRKDIVGRMFAKRTKPSNLILIWSNPKIDSVVYDPPQKCKDCLLCYRHDTTKVIVEAIKLNGRTIKS